MFTNLITSILAFASTNIDDIFILMLFYGSRRYRSTDILCGQYLGIGALLLVSVLGAYAGTFIDQRYIGLFGLFPVYLALKQLSDILKSETERNDEIEVGHDNVGMMAVAGVTIANGADNLGVYIPLLTTMTYSHKIHLFIVFAIMTFAWCELARFIADRPLVARQLDRYGHILMPLVLFCLGVYILIESNTASLLD